MVMEMRWGSNIVESHYCKTDVWIFTVETQNFASLQFRYIIEMIFGNWRETRSFLVQGGSYVQSPFRVPAFGAHQRAAWLCGGSIHSKTGEATNRDRLGAGHIERRAFWRRHDPIISGANVHLRRS